MRLVGLLLALSWGSADSRLIGDRRAGDSMNSRHLQAEFQEAGGLIVMEAESAISVPDEWRVETEVPEYTGTAYLRFNANTVMGGKALGELAYPFKINNPGKYRLSLRSNKNNTEPTWSNDCYMKVEGGSRSFGELDGYTKLFMSGTPNIWRFHTRLELIDKSKPIPEFDFDQGSYVLWVAGRSRDFFIDRLVLFNQELVTEDEAHETTLEESGTEAVSGGSSGENEDEETGDNSETTDETEPEDATDSMNSEGEDTMETDPALETDVLVKPPFQIVAGSNSEEELSIVEGNIWDSYFEPDIDMSLAPSVLASEAEAFKTHRSGQFFKYYLSGYEPGQQADIILGFAENWSPGCNLGRRIFNVLVNGQEYVTNLDVFSRVGCFTALVLSKRFSADSSGVFVVDFQPIKQNPMVSFIGVTPVGESTPPDGDNGDGTNSTISNEHITGLALVDASDRSNSIVNIIPGIQLDLAVLPNTLSIIVSTSSLVDAIIFKWDGTSHREGARPFSMDGKDGSTALKAVPYLSTPGTKTIEVEPRDANNEILETKTITFTVIDSESIAADSVRSTVVVDAGAADEDTQKISGNVWVSHAPQEIAGVPQLFPSSVFKTHRSGQAPFSYIFDGFSPRQVIACTLGFAENYERFCEKGKRIFSISVNGDEYISDLDVFDRVGCNTALVMTKYVIADDNGSLEVTFTQVEANPMVSLIVLGSISSISADSSSTSQEGDSTLTEQASPVSTGIVIDAGSETENTALISGNVWRSRFPTDIERVPDSYNEEIFKSHRSGQAPFSYTIGGFNPFEPAQLTLGFAENYVVLCKEGRRIFDVKVNGILFAEDVDVFSAVGCYTTYFISDTVTANENGEFIILFEAKRQNPMVSLVSIQPVGGPTTPEEGDTSSASSTIFLARASDRTLLRAIDEGDSINLESVGSSLSLIVEPTAANVTQARFWWNGQFHSEGVPPYSMNGKNGPNALKPVDYFSYPGTKTVEIAFVVNGSETSKQSITFNVVGEEFEDEGDENPLSGFLIDAGSENEDESLIQGTFFWKSYFDNPISNVPEFLLAEQFKSHRSGNETFSYVIDGYVPDKEYKVTLGFAETYGPNCQLGKRLFDVEVNGIGFGYDIDVYGMVGCNASWIETKTFAANDGGSFVISFMPVKGNPMVSLIAIDQESDSDQQDDMSNGSSENESSPIIGLLLARTSDRSNITDGLENGATVDLDEIGADITLVAMTTDEVERVRFKYNGASQNEGSSPFAMGGKNGQTAFQNVGYLSFPGTKTVTVEAFAADKTTLIDTLEFSLTVVGEIEGDFFEDAFVPSILIDAGSDAEDEAIIFPKGTRGFSFPPNITNVPSLFNATMFQSHRSALGFNYTISGFYPGEPAAITLGFSENYEPNCFAGKRKFGVTVNGVLFEQSIDVFGEVGCFAAYVVTKQFAADSKGDFVIDFVAEKRNPMVSLIAVNVASSLPTPSEPPSTLPSNSPFSAPSAVPSMKSSTLPSDSPSFQPSGRPSTVPSGTPSSVPSDSPSSAPSTNPSSTPPIETTQPSSSPSYSAVPSAAPSLLPTTVPSFSPSIEPTSSMAPSALPSDSPTPPPPVAEFTGIWLINAASGSKLVELTSVGGYDLSVVGNDLSILVEASGTFTHIRFQWMGATLNEGAAPFVMSGYDGVNRRYFKVPYLSVAGAKTVKIDLFNGNGNLVEKQELTFIVTDSATDNLPDFIYSDSAGTPSVTIDAGSEGEDETLIEGKIWNTYNNEMPISSVPEPFTEEMFMSHRSGYSFNYTIGDFIPYQSAEITLGFAENYAPNCHLTKRMFDVEVNGQEFQYNLDVFAEAGCFGAYVKTVIFQANEDGEFIIDFKSVKRHPMISVIQITAIKFSDQPSLVPSDMPSTMPSASPETKLSSILGYTLVRASDRAVLTPLVNGSGYFLALFGGSLSITVDTTGEVEYVKFSWEGESRVEGNTPYAMNGKDTVARFNPVAYLSTAGEKSITIETYNGDGVLLDRDILTIRVI